MDGLCVGRKYYNVNGTDKKGLKIGAKNTIFSHPLYKYITNFARLYFSYFIATEFCRVTTFNVFFYVVVIDFVLFA